MAPPPFYSRSTSFQADANEGLEAPSPADVDSELNAIAVSLNEVVMAIRRVTDANGRLKNLAAATSQALAGTDDVTASIADQTDFVTDIVWDSAYNVDNVWAHIAGLKVSVASVQDDGSGFLEVTIAAQDIGTVVTVSAFESGAGILTDLQTTGSATKGANLIGIEDDGGYTSETTQEGATQELYSRITGASGKTWLEGVLVMTDYLKKIGGTMTGDIAFSSGAKISGLPASAANGQAVRHEQLTALSSTVSGITTTFMPKAGGTFTGSVNFGSFASTGVATPTTSDAIASKGYVDTTLASFGGLPVGTIVDYGATSPPTGWLTCDGSAVSRTIYTSLFAVIGVSFGVGDGTTTFNVPDTRGRVTIGTGTGSGLTVRALNDSGGTETHVLALTEIPAHSHALSPVGTDTGGAQNVADDSGTGAGATASAGGGLAHQNMQPWRAVNKIIKF